MKVLVITGSAHRNGTTAALAEQFIRGAEEAGHTVVRFDAAFKKVHPCIACEQCHDTAGGCVFQDDMEELNPQLLAADAVALVSPIYYYGMNAQIKVVIDRFYANDAALHGPKKAVLLVAMADESMDSAEGALASFGGTVRYLGWQDAGTLVARGCADAAALQRTDYPRRAFQLGLGL